MERAAAEARLLGVKALRLEINHANTHARGLYSKTGFEDDRRDLFTRWL
jgi:ribosomal protein S18 acetylase RimI-like enzyme